MITTGNTYISSTPLDNSCSYFRGSSRALMCLPFHFPGSSWIIHPYPRKLVVCAGQIKRFYNNIEAFDAEFVDAIIRRFNQLDITIADGNSGTRWRHFLETDFAVGSCYYQCFSFTHIAVFLNTIFCLSCDHRCYLLVAIHHTICCLSCTNSCTWTIASHFLQWLVLPSLL